MVKVYSEPLDRTFAALSDPTRRALVMRLAAEPGTSVSQLAAPFAVSLPAIMKHLDVLSDAGLIARTKSQLDETAELIRQAGGKAVVTPTDVSKRDQVAALHHFSLVKRPPLPQHFDERADRVALRRIAV